MTPCSKYAKFNPSMILTVMTEKLKDLKPLHEIGLGNENTILLRSRVVGRTNHTKMVEQYSDVQTGKTRYGLLS